MKLRIDPEGRGLWIGDRHVPWAEVNTSDLALPPDLPAFAERHALVRFENGHVISMAWGSCTYSDNYASGTSLGRPFVEEPERVEVMVFAAESGPMQGEPACLWVEALPGLVDHVAALPTRPPEGEVFEIRWDDEALAPYGIWQ